MRSLLVLCLLVVSTYASDFKEVVVDPTLNWRVIGGSNAPDGEYPYQVSLRWYSTHRCGGSIIHEEWVITAAHCIISTTPNEYKVFAGTNQLNGTGIYYKVLDMEYHRGYNSITGLNDVGIMKVERMTFNDKVNKIALEKNDVPGDVPVILSGWGSTRLGGATPMDLQHVNLKSTSLKQCQDAHANSGRPVEETQICTLTKAGEGACHGDSGGPLITDTNGDRKQVGIVSWGQPCARGYPDVFARVSSYYDWFNKQCKNCLEILN